ncbi:MAG: hypothetical protein RR588_03325 [Solibacillus sp.]
MKQCKYCGAYLDAGEMCDCEEAMRERGWVRSENGNYYPKVKKSPQTKQQLMKAD